MLRLQRLVTGTLIGCLAVCTSACPASRPEQKPTPQGQTKPPPPKGPALINLVEKEIQFQDQSEPFLTEKTFEFDLPRPPRRARLVLRYSGVPGATSEDYTMGRFRHRVEINGTFLMDLNTHSDGEDHVVEYTHWIHYKLFKRHNTLRFIAGDDGRREGRPDRDEYSLRAAKIEFDW